MNTAPTIHRVRSRARTRLKKKTKPKRKKPPSNSKSNKKKVEQLAASAPTATASVSGRENEHTVNTIGGTGKAAHKEAEKSRQKRKSSGNKRKQQTKSSKGVQKTKAGKDQSKTDGVARKEPPGTKKMTNGSSGAAADTLQAGTLPQICTIPVLACFFSV